MTEFWFNFGMAWWLIGCIILVLPTLAAIHMVWEAVETTDLREFLWGVLGFALFGSILIASWLGWLAVVP